MPGGTHRRTDKEQGGHESPVSRQDSGQVQSKEGPEPGDTGREWKWVSSRLGVQERLVDQPLLWVGSCSLAKRKDVEVLTQCLRIFGN